MWGATLLTLKKNDLCKISIHAPRVRCDKSFYNIFDFSSYFNPRTSCEVRLLVLVFSDYSIIFQSTHLVWGATIKRKNARNKHNISIHAPRVRCDFRSWWLSPFVSLFQSTHLVWGATYTVHDRFGGDYISIHAPRVRCDFCRISQSGELLHFNPRTSCEVRHLHCLH